jgi:hypothetical protein
MRAIHLLTGCVLGLCLAATAQAATNADAGSAGTADCAHGAADGGSAHDTAPTSGDIVDLSHSSSTTGTPASAPSSGKGGGDSVIRSGGGGDDAPSHPHQVSLGWQSLLPGSIQ